MFGLPLLFMLVSSLKPDTQIFGDLTSVKAFLPVGDISLDNYTAVFDRVPFWRFLMNSIVISALTVALGLIVNSMCAFALARLKFRGRAVILGVIIATLIVPFETLALPLLWWVNKLPYYDGSVGWLDTYEVQIIPFIANAFSIYLFYQYFDSIPKELDEAAMVDGAGWFTIYRKIVMPLSGPAIATVAILTFLPAWNQYLWPLMVVQTEELRPVMVGIDYFKQLNTVLGPDHGLRLADHHPGPGAVHRLPTLLHQQHRLLRRERLTCSGSPTPGCGTSGSPKTTAPTTCSSCTPPGPCTTPTGGTCGRPSGTRSPPIWSLGTGADALVHGDAGELRPDRHLDRLGHQGPRRQVVHVLHRHHPDPRRRHWSSRSGWPPPPT